MAAAHVFRMSRMNRNAVRSFCICLGVLILIVPLVGACGSVSVAATTSAPQARGAIVPVKTRADTSSLVYPLKVSSTGRYLVDQNNQPVFWSGDAGWSAIVQGTNADIDTYMTNRQSHGVNVVIVNLIDHLFCTNAPRDLNGDPPFKTPRSPPPTKHTLLMPTTPSPVLPRGVSRSCSIRCTWAPSAAPKAGVPKCKPPRMPTCRAGV